LYKFRSFVNNYRHTKTEQWNIYGRFQFKNRTSEEQIPTTIKKQMTSSSLSSLTATSADNKIIKTPTTPNDETSRKNIIRVGVVPEHFSTPFHIGFDKHIFKKHNLILDVIEHPRGTGSMCKDLRENKLDVAIALTEGLVSDIVKNENEDVYRIIGTYVQSPLHWAIATKPDRIKSISELNDKTIGISRFGSGSHIMSFLLAERENWYTSSDCNDHNLSVKFEPCGGLDDLRNGIATEKIDTFLWERFMLKNFFDKGELNYLGEIVTPWPCFMIAARNDIVNTHGEHLARMMDAIKECCDLFYKNKDSSLDFISKACHLSLEDADKWFQTVEFAKNPRSVSTSMLDNTMNTLLRTKVLQEPLPSAHRLFNGMFTQND
jgi:sulfonate transport system substrate-binding protein